MDKENTVKYKSRKFAARIVNLYKYLCEEKHEYVLSKQLLRSGTSIGANIAESECAMSKKDFLAKIYIALKECAESKYWLELLYETQYLTKDRFDSIYADCEELRKMMSSTTKTMNSTLHLQNSKLDRNSTLNTPHSKLSKNSATTKTISNSTLNTPHSTLNKKGIEKNGLRNNLAELGKEKEEMFKLLILSIKESECSARDIQLSISSAITPQQLRKSSARTFMNTVLKPAIGMHLIEPLFPDSPHHPHQKYKLTETGKALQDFWNEEL